MLTYDNTYTVRKDCVGGTDKFYASFVDSSGKRQEAEISEEIYAVLEDYRKHEWRQRHFRERHQEFSEQSEEQLIARAKITILPLSKVVDLSIDIESALKVLTEGQRLRFLQHFYQGMSYGQIAAEEGCTKQAVAQSISTEITGIKKYFADEH